MKKIKIKRFTAVLLAVIMMFGVMGITAYASEDDPVVTVYFTKHNFTSGGYDFEEGEPIYSYYIGTSPAPTYQTRFSDDLFSVQVHINQINLTDTRSVYNSGYTGAKNALDVIIAALQSESRVVHGGWDLYSDPQGGYITGFDDDGSTDYYGYVIYPDDISGEDFYLYTGTNWQFAYNTSVNGTLVESDTYGTNVTNLFDGMVIVFDLSYYSMYYPVNP